MITEEHKQALLAGRVAKAEVKRVEAAQAAEVVRLQLQSAAERMTVLEGKVEVVTGSLERISGLLTRFIEVSDHKPIPNAPVVKESSASDDAGFFPPKFRRIIDRKLGPDFRAELQESSGADCILKIFLPTQWDCRVGEEKKMTPCDIRVGLIHKASDIQDVEKWCILFASNIKKTYPNFVSPESKII